MTKQLGTAHVAMLALLTAGCAGGAGGGEQGETTSATGQETTTGVDTTSAVTDVDGDGIPDDQDDFIDLNGNGIDDRQEGNIDADGDGRPDCVPGVLGTSQLPRLKNAEYDRTIRDLLGLTGLSASGGASPSSLLATDQTGSLSDLGWSSYQTVAEMIAAQVMADANLKANFIDCDPAAAGCLDQTITDFGRRAFRRPLSDEDVARFQALANPAHTQNGTPDEVAELVLYGFLVSPTFLMRSEVNETPSTSGGDYTLSSHEIASRLSYMLWGSMPDEALDTAADTGQLASKEQILAQAKRMVADPKAREIVAELHRDYLHMGLNTRWDTFVKEPTRYPAFNEGLRAIFRTETEMFFDNVVFNGGSFSDLFLSTQGFVNAETAALYGVDGTGLSTDLVPTELPDRPGFLTRLGFLNAFSQAARTSPILRGAFIAKDVLGTKIGTPPPGAEGTPLPESPDLKTNRERVSAQTSDAVCAECHHQYINPPGFVMEYFDTMGAPQTIEADSQEPVDTNANVYIDQVPTPISTPAELMNLIANSEGARYFYAHKWVGYAFKRASNSQDACMVEVLSANLASEGYTILDLIAELSLANSFTVRALESGVTQ